MLNLIEGDADSFAQRAEMYYKKRPELVNMIEDFYRSYRYLAEQHELLRSEAAVARRSSTLSKSDSDLTEVDDYPESEVSEVDNPEPEEDADQIESAFLAANEGFEAIGKNLEAKSPLPSPILNRSAAAEPESAKSYKSKRVSYLYGNKQRCLQMEIDDHDLERRDEISKESDRNTMNSMNEGLEVCSANTRYSSIFPLDLDYLYSKESDRSSRRECKVDDLETKALFEKIVDDVAKLTSEVEGLRLEKEALMAELERKDEEKRQVIRQLSLTVEILKEENVVLKKFIKDSKKSGSLFELKKLKEAFSGTRRLFGLTARFQPSLVAL